MPRFSFPPPGKQVYVASFLANVRRTGLHEAVRVAAAALPAKTLRSEIQTFAPADGLQVIQGTQIRDEEVLCDSGSAACRSRNSCVLSPALGS